MKLATWIGGAGGLLFAVRHAFRLKRRISFRDRSVLITGGSRGLGLEMARLFASEGARVALVARDADELARAAAQITALGGTVMTLPADLTIAGEPERVVAEVARAFAGLDILVNDAGNIQMGPREHMSERDFAEALALNFWAPLRCIQAAVPIMRAGGVARIVNITSIGGKVAVPHLMPYSASKFAFVGLSDAMRGELDQHGIRVTTVVPGLMRTGSHVNATFKGRNQAEYAFFSIVDAAPGLSVSATRAARQILRACRHGDRQLVIGVAARAAIVVQALMPDLFANVMAAANRALPRPDPSGGDLAHTGWDSQSSLSPSMATRLADRVVPENNELREHDPEELGLRRRFN